MPVGANPPEHTLLAQEIWGNSLGRAIYYKQLGLPYAEYDRLTGQIGGGGVPHNPQASSEFTFGEADYRKLVMVGEIITVSR